MSEHDPTPEQDKKEPSMSIEYQGIKFEMTPENTAAYLHEEEPNFDHLFYTQDGGYLYLFRRNVSNFDDVAAYMERNGYEINREAFAAEQDKQQYFERYGYPEIPTRELTPREERKLLFARYLLEHEHITPESFNGTGRMA